MTFFNEQPEDIQNTIHSLLEVDELEKIIKSQNKRAGYWALKSLFERKDRRALEAQRRYLRKWIAKPEITQLETKDILRGMIQPAENILHGKAGLYFEDKFLRLEYLVMRQLGINCNYANLMQYDDPTPFFQTNFFDILPVLSSQQLKNECSSWSEQALRCLSFTHYQISRIPKSIIQKKLSLLFKEVSLDFNAIKILIATLPWNLAKESINEFYELLSEINEPNIIANSLDYFLDYFSLWQLEELTETLLSSNHPRKWQESIEKALKKFSSNSRDVIIQEITLRIQKEGTLDWQSAEILYCLRNFLSDFQWASLIIKKMVLHNLEDNIQKLTPFFKYLPVMEVDTLMGFYIKEFNKINSSHTDTNRRFRKRAKKFLIQQMTNLAPYASEKLLIDECIDYLLQSTDSEVNFYPIAKKIINSANIESIIQRCLDRLNDEHPRNRHGAIALLQHIFPKSTSIQLEQFKDLLFNALRNPTEKNEDILFLSHFAPLSFNEQERVKLSRIFNAHDDWSLHELSRFLLLIHPILSANDALLFFEKLLLLKNLSWGSEGADLVFSVIITKMNPADLIVKVGELLGQPNDFINKYVLKVAINKLPLHSFNEALVSKIFDYFVKTDNSYWADNFYWLVQKFSSPILTTKALTLINSHQVNGGDSYFMAMDILLERLNGLDLERLIDSFIEKFKDKNSDSRTIIYQEKFIQKLVLYMSKSQAATILMRTNKCILFGEINPCIAEQLLVRVSSEERNKMHNSYIREINNNNIKKNDRKMMLEIITNQLMQVSNQAITDEDREKLTDTLKEIVGQTSYTIEFFQLKAFASLCLTLLLKRKVLTQENTPLLLRECLKNSYFTSVPNPVTETPIYKLECDSELKADVFSRALKKLGISSILEMPNQGKWEFQLSEESENYIGFSPDLLKKAIYHSVNEQLNPNTRSAYESLFNKKTAKRHNLKAKEKLLYAFKAILNDYTKGNAWYSGASRFFHGHANRHHTKDVADIVGRIGVEIKEPLALLETLEKEIPRIHLGGSLTRRKAFMWNKYHQYMEKELKLNDTQTQSMTHALSV